MKNQSYFPALTGIRAIAAYMVFFHHYNEVFSRGTVANDLVRELHVGVTLFFVLSGFLIAYRYFDTERPDLRNYFVNRIARTYPMYFLLTTLTFSSYAFTKGNLITYLLNITFIRGYSSRYLFTGLSQGWSLSVEETFYLLAPLLFVLLRRNKYNFLLLPAALVTIGIMLVILFSQVRLYGFMDNYSLLFGYTFFGRCAEFFIGIGLAVIYKHRTIIKGSYLTYAGIGVIGLCIWLLSLQKGRHDFGVMSSGGRLINNLILPMFGVAVLFYGLLTEETFVSRILGSKLFVLLGKSSYIFYLIHLGVVATYLQRTLPRTAVLFFILNILSVILFKLVEEPLNNFLRIRFSVPLRR